ncbi:hypothetical protein F5B19DRAFT_406550 [Rostrohypoxylon terebratum]|nr:hypothetical protein F5B19DRAFT_406550 [Rostrohypoxylon terebratum]
MSAEQPGEQPGEQPVGQLGGQPAEKPAEKPDDSAMDIDDDYPEFEIEEKPDSELTPDERAVRSMNQALEKLHILSKTVEFAINRTRPWAMALYTGILPGEEPITWGPYYLDLLLKHIMEGRRRVAALQKHEEEIQNFDRNLMKLGGPFEKVEHQVGVAHGIATDATRQLDAWEIVLRDAEWEEVKARNTRPTAVSAEAGEHGNDDSSPRSSSSSSHDGDDDNGPHDPSGDDPADDDPADNDPTSPAAAPLAALAGARVSVSSRGRESSISSAGDPASDPVPGNDGGDKPSDDDVRRSRMGPYAEFYEYFRRGDGYCRKLPPRRLLTL